LTVSQRTRQQNIFRLKTSPWIYLMKAVDLKTICMSAVSAFQKRSNWWPIMQGANCMVIPSTPSCRGGGQYARRPSLNAQLARFYVSNSQLFASMQRQFKQFHCLKGLKRSINACILMPCRELHIVFTLFSCAHCRIHFEKKFTNTLCLVDNDESSSLCLDRRLLCKVTSASPCSSRVTLLLLVTFFISWGCVKTFVSRGIMRDCPTRVAWIAAPDLGLCGPWADVIVEAPLIRNHHD
jgi:hypothetical protein